MSNRIRYNAAIGPAADVNTEQSMTLRDHDSGARVIPVPITASYVHKTSVSAACSHNKRHPSEGPLQIVVRRYRGGRERDIGGQIRPAARYRVIPAPPISATPRPLVVRLYRPHTQIPRFVPQHFTHVGCERRVSKAEHFQVTVSLCTRRRRVEAMETRKLENKKFTPAAPSAAARAGARYLRVLARRAPE
ncbi:hypothetical protein EVAR_65972_1 [Eumeta japonica]|uniref:Uncharacterized protein n=1 Tax=Eumeta variegata TaxID=151549 RepID=A0A4C1ZAW7_EUMVA|nr:hypothetical protein EVAR_65972_1 [Eumeta japonica]